MDFREGGSAPFEASTPFSRILCYRKCIDRPMALGVNAKGETYGHSPKLKLKGDIPRVNRVERTVRVYGLKMVPNSK